jgi:hypothetical protein
MSATDPRIAVSPRYGPHGRPDRTTLVARSLLACNRLPEGSPERALALRLHFQEFARQPSGQCRLASRRR